MRQETKPTVKFGPRFVNRTGHAYGRMTVLSFVEMHATNAKWLCRCECGEEKVVYGCHLASGKIVSCGCFNTDQLVERTRTHGFSKETEYHIWQTMKARCLNPNHDAYKHYGGRGIRICERWLGSFENFFEDMQERPSLQQTLERRDNGGDYTPENCYWATRSEQGNNTRANRIIEFQGRKQTMTQWGREVEIPAAIIGQRISRDGWSVERALTTPNS